MVSLPALMATVLEERPPISNYIPIHTAYFPTKLFRHTDSLTLDPRPKKVLRDYLFVLETLRNVTFTVRTRTRIESRWNTYLCMHVTRHVITEGDENLKTPTE